MKTNRLKYLLFLLPGLLLTTGCNKSLETDLAVSGTENRITVGLVE